MRELGQASGTYAYGDALADLDTSFLNFDFLESSGACIVGDPATVKATKAVTPRPAHIHP